MGKGLTYFYIVSAVLSVANGSGYFCSGNKPRAKDYQTLKVHQLKKLLRLRNNFS